MCDFIFMLLKWFEVGLELWLEKVPCQLRGVGSWEKPNWGNSVPSASSRIASCFSIYISGPHESFCLKKSFHRWTKKSSVNLMISGLMKLHDSIVYCFMNFLGRFISRKKYFWIICRKLLWDYKVKMINISVKHRFYLSLNKREKNREFLNFP